MTRKNFRWLIPMIAFVAFVLGSIGTPNVQAERMHQDDYAREESDISKMFHKLGRGVTNILFGWIELPRNIAREWRRSDPFTGTIVGTFKGIGWTVARTLVGVYEVVSFPFPVPNDYVTIMQPEFVLPTVWGDRLPLYRDEYMAASSNVDPVMDYGRTAAQPRESGRSRSITPGGRSY